MSSCAEVVPKPSLISIEDLIAGLRSWIIGESFLGQTDDGHSQNVIRKAKLDTWLLSYGISTAEDFQQLQFALKLSGIHFVSYLVRANNGQLEIVYRIIV